MTLRRPHDDARIRTPSSAMLVQMLFVIGAVGTGVVGALVTWLGPKKSDDVATPEKRPEARDED